MKGNKTPTRRWLPRASKQRGHESASWSGRDRKKEQQRGVGALPGVSRGAVGMAGWGRMASYFPKSLQVTWEQLSGLTVPEEGREGPEREPAPPGGTWKA